MANLGYEPVSGRRWRKTQGAFLALLSLSLVHCSSADNMPAKTVDTVDTVDQALSNDDDGWLVCPDDSVHADEVCGWNSMLELNPELRKAIGLSRIVTCEEAHRFQRGVGEYLEAHPDFYDVVNDRWADAGWPDCSWPPSSRR